MQKTNMGEQEVFDTAVAAVIAQGAPSVTNRGTCVYKSEGGLKCAVGHLIDRDYYRHKWDKDGVSAETVIRDASADVGLPILAEGFRMGLLEDLQVCHDRGSEQTGDEFIQGFKRRCREVAADYGLDPTVLDRT